MALAGAAAGEPTIVHLSAFTFGRRAHPAIYRTVTALSRHFRNLVLSDNRPGYFPTNAGEREPTEPGVDVLPITPDSLAEPARARAIASAFERRYGRISAVIGHLGANGWKAIHLARHLSAPILTIFHGADADAEMWRLRGRLAYGRLRVAPGAFFLGVSANLVRRLIDFGMPPERTFLHHLGIDFASYPLPERQDAADSRRIIIAGRFRPQKGHELALRGFSQFVQQFPDWSLHHFGGDGNAAERALGRNLLAQVQTMGLGSSVYFHGGVPVDVLRNEFAAAEIALHTSVCAAENRRIEGLPNVVLEAMASGLPVVATRQAGLPDAVLHERTGLLVDENDVSQLAAALGRLAASRELRLQYGREGRRRVEQEFNADRQGERLAERIHRMCEGYAGLDTRAREQSWQTCTRRGRWHAFDLIRRPFRRHRRGAQDGESRAAVQPQ